MSSRQNLRRAINYDLVLSTQAKQRSHSGTLTHVWKNAHAITQAHMRTDTINSKTFITIDCPQRLTISTHRCAINRTHTQTHTTRVCRMKAKSPFFREKQGFHCIAFHTQNWLPFLCLRSAQIVTTEQTHTESHAYSSTRYCSIVNVYSRKFSPSWLEFGIMVTPLLLEAPVWRHSMYAPGYASSFLETLWFQHACSSEESVFKSFCVCWSMLWLQSIHLLQYSSEDSIQNYNYSASGLCTCTVT